MRFFRRVPVLVCLAVNRRSLEQNGRSLKPTFPVVYSSYPTSESTAHLFSHATQRYGVTLNFFRIIVVGSSDRTQKYIARVASGFKLRHRWKATTATIKSCIHSALPTPGPTKSPSVPEPRIKVAMLSKGLS